LSENPLQDEPEWTDVLSLVKVEIAEWPERKRYSARRASAEDR
jgi:hypothetical protein